MAGFDFRAAVTAGAEASSAPSRAPAHHLTWDPRIQAVPPRSARDPPLQPFRVLGPQDLPLPTPWALRPGPIVSARGARRGASGRLPTTPGPAPSLLPGSGSRARVAALNCPVFDLWIWGPDAVGFYCTEKKSQRLDPGSAAVTLGAGAAGGSQAPLPRRGWRDTPCPASVPAPRAEDGEPQLRRDARLSPLSAQGVRDAMLRGRGPQTPSSGRTAAAAATGFPRKAAQIRGLGPPLRPPGAGGAGGPFQGNRTSTGARLVMARRPSREAFLSGCCSCAPTLSRGRPAKPRRRAGSQSPDALDAAARPPRRRAQTPRGCLAPRRAPGSHGGASASPPRPSAAAGWDPEPAAGSSASPAGWPRRKALRAAREDPGRPPPERTGAAHSRTGSLPCPRPQAPAGSQGRGALSPQGTQSSSFPHSRVFENRSLPKHAISTPARFFPTIATKEAPRLRPRDQPSHCRETEALGVNGPQSVGFPAFSQGWVMGEGKVCLLSLSVT